MTSVFTLYRMTNALVRAEVRNYHSSCRKWKNTGQIVSICKTSSAAPRQQTPICRGGTGTCKSPFGSMFGNGSLHNKYNLTQHLSCHRRGVRYLFTSGSRSKKEEITVNFLNIDGETIPVKAKVGETLLDTVIDNDVDIDGFGACEGTLACSTCHLIFDEELFEMLPEKLDEEEDMLDLAYGLTDTSRLGCQIVLTKEMDNMVVRVPEGIADARDV